MTIPWKHRPLWLEVKVSTLFNAWELLVIYTHLLNNNLFKPCQSVFCPFHSTETAMVKVTNDLLVAADSGLLTVLIQNPHREISFY